MEPVKARSEVPSLTDEIRPQVPATKRLPNVLAKLHGWWLSLISWYLSLTMMRYAFIKIIPAQFHSPESPIQFSPIESLDNFRLAWVFLGRAPGYGFALGLIEALGALALLFPATRLAGSCVIFIALAQIVLVDYFYEIPALSYAIQLLLMTGWLLLAQAIQNWPLIRQLLWQPRPRSASLPWRRYAGLALRTLGIGMILNFSLGRGIEYLNEVRQIHLESERPLIGGWDVVSHTCSPCPQGPEKVIRHILFEEDYYGAYTQRGLLRGNTQMLPGSHSFQLLPHKEPAIKGSWQRIRQGMRLTLHASQRTHTLTLIRHDRIP